MFFKNFPKTLYNFTTRDDKDLFEFVVSDITLGVRVKKEILDNIVLYDWYSLGDGETPEIVSKKFYGSQYYHWIIMLFNNKYDYINDFPLSGIEFDKFVTLRYGEGNYNVTHHYETKEIKDPNGNIILPSGLWVDPDYEFRYGDRTYGSLDSVQAVSNYEHEVAENEKKRLIKIIDAQLLSEVLKQLKEIKDKASRV